MKKDIFMEELLDIHYNGQLELYVSRKIEKENYDILLSDVILDHYWNTAYLKNYDIDFNSIWQDIKNEMKKEHRTPIVYITSNKNTLDLERKIEESNLKVINTDVWMVLEDSHKLNEVNSKIDFSVHKVDESLKDKFIEAIMDGFSSDNPEDPYTGLSDGYKIALERNFNGNNGAYKVIHYLGLYNNEAISTATVIFKGSSAIIYNVTTNKKYKKQGVCKKMMSYIVKDLKNLNIDIVSLQTEKGFYTEQVYKRMGFKEVILGKAYGENVCL